MKNHERIRQVIAQFLGHQLADVKPESSLVALGADSLDLLEIAMVVEEEFGVYIPDTTVERWSLVSDILKEVSDD